MLSILLVFFMGLILPFAFAPFSIYTFAFIAPAVLLWQWKKSSPLQALVKGWFFGLGFFGLGISWIYISIHNFGGASIFVASLITLALVAGTALCPALQGYLLVRLWGKKSPLIFCLAAFPATWIIFIEWARNFPFGGFPWLFLGYSQIDTPLRGFAPYLSVYGVSLAVTIICGCLVIICTRELKIYKIWALIILISTLLLGWVLTKPTWTKPISEPIKVSLIQANIPQSIKWQAGKLESIVQTYLGLTDPHWDSRLIIWSEAALPAFANQASGILNELNQKSLDHHTTLLLGLLLGDAQTQYYNGLVLLGKDRGEYRKYHLVPFGEYIPLPHLFSFLLNYWQIPMSNFSRGPELQDNLKVSGYEMAPFVCYEIAYPSEVLRYIRNKAFIINISDDSWFGKSMASVQQMQMARLRALETGRYALLDGNTGVTAIIDPKGHIIDSIPQHQQGVLTGTFKAMEGQTPLMRWHFYPLIAILFIFLALATLL